MSQPASPQSAPSPSSSSRPTSPQSPQSSTTSQDEIDGKNLDAKAAVGSIVHLLETRFKDVYARNEEYQQQVITIKKRLARQNEQASNLLSYLTNQHSKSNKDSETINDLLKKQGVIVNAHLPETYSELNLSSITDVDGDGVDGDESSSYGNFKLNLVSAHALIADNHERKLRLNGTLPVSKFIGKTKSLSQSQTRSASNTKDGGGGGEGDKGYLKQTSTNLKRNSIIIKYSRGPNGGKYNSHDALDMTTKMDEVDMIDQRIKTIKFEDEVNTTTDPHISYITKNEKPLPLEYVPSSKTQSVASKTSASSSNLKTKTLLGTGTEAPIKKQIVVRNEGEQWDLDMSVLNGMKSKLDYLRNPRYVSKAKASASTSPFLNNNDSGSGSSSGGNEYIRASPETVTFHNHTLNKTYTQLLHITNITHTSTNITILPSYSKHFSFKSITYPNSGVGLLAPGMSVKISVQFTPDSLADYSDVISIQSSSPNCKILNVPIVAYRDKPVLSIPKVFNVGSCLVGDITRRTFVCKNTGGNGNFRVLSTDDYPVPSKSQNRLNSMTSGPFKLTPTEFTLNTGDAVTLTLQYSPVTIGLNEVGFYVVCDNCDVDEYSIEGVSECVDVGICGVNGVTIDINSNNSESESESGLEETKLKVLDFDTVTIGGSIERTIEVRNYTKSELPFRWDMRTFVPYSSISNPPETKEKKSKSKLKLLTGLGKGKDTDTGSSSSSSSSSNDDNIGWGGRVKVRDLSSNTSTDSDSGASAIANCNDDALGFTITPRYGVFPADSTTMFTCTYSPTSPTSNSPNANASIETVLVIEGIPPSSIPSPSQSTLLLSLASNGHGRYFRMQAWFKAKDIDGGGTLDKAELMSALESMGMQSHSRAIRELLDMLDTNGDGEISIDEFLSNIPKSLIEAIDEVLADIDISSVKEAIMKEVDYLAFKMRGTNEHVSVKVNVDPVVLNFPGRITAGVVYSKEVSVTNYSDVDAVYEFEQPSFSNYDYDSTTGGGDEDKIDPEDYLVDIAPRSGFIKARTTVTASVAFSGKPIGLVNLILPYTICSDNSSSNNSNSNSDNATNVRTSSIKLEAEIIPPRLRITNSELDFGLVAVGAEKTIQVSFTNEGDVPFAWACLNLPNGTTSTGGGGVGSSVMSPPNSPSLIYGAGSRSPKRGRSMISSVSMTSLFSDSTNGGFKIDSPFSTLKFDTAEGVLQPKQSATVNVICHAGKLQQRLRTTLQILTSDALKVYDYSPAYVSVRAEIQAPMVYIDTTSVDFNVCYVGGGGVVRVVNVKNLSNLDTKFKFERPAGASSSFNVKFEPASGELSSKQILKVKVIYTAKNVCEIDDVLACRIFGMSNPLGFKIKAVNKSVVVSYELLADNQTIPKPLCTPDSVQFTSQSQSQAGVVGGEDLLKPAKIPKLCIDGDVPLFTRKAMRFIIRNLSAVPAKFRINAGEYGHTDADMDMDMDGVDLNSSSITNNVGGSVFDLNETFMKSTTQTTNKNKNKTTKKPILTNQNERTHAYSTPGGQDYTRAKIEYMQDSSILKSSGSKGFAIQITPSSGDLVPWGVTEVVVMCYNNMPGTYRDVVYVDIDGVTSSSSTISNGGGGSTTTAAGGGSKGTKLEFYAKVTGNPLTLKKECLGLDMLTNPSLPNMKFGEVTVNCNSISRKVVVKNAGPIDALMKWSVREIADGGVNDKLVSLSFGFSSNDNNESNGENEDEDEGYNPEKPIDFKLRLYEKPVFKSPFSITPISALIPRHGEAAFTLTLSQSNLETIAGRVGDYKDWSRMLESLMVADVQWQHKVKDKEVARKGSTESIESLSNTSLANSISLASIDSKGSKKTQNSRKTNGTGTGTGSSSDGGLERSTMGAIKLAVGAKAVLPFLSMEKRRHGERNLSISDNDDDINEIKQHIKFNITSTEHKMYQETSVFSENMQQTLTLKNPLSIPLEFAITSTGPFKILQAKTLAVQHAHYNSPSKAKWNVGRGRLFLLAVGESLDVVVGFLGAENGDGDDDDSGTMKIDTVGRLKLLFNTSHEQFIELKGELIRPLIIAQPADYNFGTVHTENMHKLIMFIMNPTTVPASWSLTHIPYELPKRARMILDKAHELNQVYIDEPDVFIFSDSSGVLSGPTLPLQSTGGCLPDDKNRISVTSHHAPVFTKNSMSLTWKSGDTHDLMYDDKLRKTNAINPRQPRAVTVVFKPKKNVRYRSRFRFEVEGGGGCDVLVTGRGTFEEGGGGGPAPARPPLK